MRLMVLLLAGVVLVLVLAVPMAEAKKEKKKIDICIFPSEGNFKTKSINESEFLRPQEQKGELMGSCEDNCLSICFAEDSPILPYLCTAEDTEDCVNRCLPDAAAAVALVLTGSEQEEHMVEACDEDSLLLVGPRASTIIYPGMFLIYVDETDEGDGCGIDCSPLFRRVESVAENEGGSVFVTTSFAMFSEILGPDFDLDPAVQGKEIEPLLECHHSTSHIQEQGMAIPKEVQAFPASCKDQNDWLKKDVNGVCIYTACHLGKDGNPNDCFECGTECDKGCGAGGIGSFNGDFGAFSFSPACFNHHHCWSR